MAQVALPGPFFRAFRVLCGQVRIEKADPFPDIAVRNVATGVVFPVGRSPA